VSPESGKKMAKNGFPEIEKRYRALFEHSLDGILLTRADGSIVDANPAACAILRMSKEEICAAGRAGLVEATPATLALLKERETTGKASGQLTFILKDGTRLPAEFGSVILYDETEPWTTFVIFRDISERKATEEMLYLTRSSVEEAGDHIYWMDPTGRIIYANRSACARLGYSKEELVGMSISEINVETPPGEREARWAEIREKGSVTFEKEHRTKTGEAFPVEIVSTLFEREGREYNIAFARELTERKRAEESLALAQFSIEYAAIGIIWIDCDGRIVEANRAICERLGYTREELLQMTVFDITVDLDHDSWAERQRYLRKHGPLTFEKEHCTRDGEVFPVEINSWNFEHQGVEYTYGYVLDITERKKTEATLRDQEERLRQSQKMEAIGQLAGGIAHDFNNLLTAIIGYSDLILADPRTSDSTLREDVLEIKKAADRATGLTKQILAFSRRQALQPKVLRVNDLVRETEPLLRRTLGEDIDLVTRLGEASGFVEVDPHQLMQVIMNLAVNARDAMPVGGTLTIETSAVELDEGLPMPDTDIPPGLYATITVSDTGVGMDKQTMARVFEPFFTTKRPGEGTGLGLSTVYGIVRQSGGGVTVVSEPGEGTRFRVYLQAVTAPAEEAPEPGEAVAARTGTGTVLVVEDEEAVRGLVQRVLTDEGYTVIVAESATEALAALELVDGPLDLLLTDVVLPGGMQGSDLVEVAVSYQRDLPVLYMSGYTQDSIVEAGRVREGIEFLAKPFTPDILKARIREVLAGHRPVTP